LKAGRCTGKGERHEHDRKGRDQASKNSKKQEKNQRTHAGKQEIGQEQFE
jgi:hypothetical protein